MLITRQGVDVHCFDKAQQIDRDWLVPLESALVYLHHDLASNAHSRELAPRSRRHPTSTIPGMCAGWRKRPWD